MMRLPRILKIIAVGGLILIMGITLLYAKGIVAFNNFTILLLTGTLVWFAGILLANMVKK